jgi:hypothetical protein
LGEKERLVFDFLKRKQRRKRTDDGGKNETSGDLADVSVEGSVGGGGSKLGTCERGMKKRWKRKEEGRKQAVSGEEESVWEEEVDGPV